MSVTKKTYTALIELPDVLIGRCSQVLPNRLQCWRGADYLIEEELPPAASAAKTEAKADKETKPEAKIPEEKKPAESKTPEAKPPAPSLKQQQGEPLGQPGSGTTSDQKEEQAAGAKAAPPPTTRTYQLCSMHATIQQRADTLAEQAEASGQSTPPDSDPKSIHSRMMQAEQRARTSGMPSGERTAQG